MARIAVVDDEKNIREVIRIALEKDFFTVDEYADGLAAWEVFRSKLPDLVILDISMPRMDGIELCKNIRRVDSATPVIFLSSRDEEIDRVLGLESGGDDYVCKPFSLRELLARIRAALRRQNRSAETSFERPAGDPQSSGLVLDKDRFIAVWNGISLEFTVTEFRMLQSLGSKPGFIKTREQLMAAAFPEDNFPNDRAADSHIKRIRKKFAAADSTFDKLEAVYGLGYKWKDE